MTINQRVNDAEFLWNSGRHEGAFLMALIAFAATARKVYPDEKSDSKAFRQLFQEQFRSGASVRFRDDMPPMDRLFYKWLRCQLVHEGGLPIGLEINAEDAYGLFTIALVEGFPVAISATWYHSLIISIIGHPVNCDEYPHQEEMLRSALRQRRSAGQRILGSSGDLFPELTPTTGANEMKTVQGKGIDLSKKRPSAPRSPGSARTPDSSAPE
jgi:hypothetical protein